MNYIKITTPENIEVEYLLAGAGSRIAAGVIDLIIQSFAVIIILIALAIVGYNNSLNNESISVLDKTYVSWIVAISILLFFLIYYLYFIVFEMIMNGQSIGKKIFGLRVIRDNGQPITLSQSFVRNIFKYFIDFYGVGIISIMFSKKCKRIGDMVASTIVINDSINLKPSMFIFQPSTTNNNKQNIIINETAFLSSEERSLVKEYLNKKASFIDNGSAVAEKLDSYFINKYNMTLNEVLKNIF